MLTWTGVNATTTGLTPTYDAKGRIVSVARPNNAPTTMQYDNLNRVTQLKQDLDGAATTYDITWDFVYNPASQLRSITASNVKYEHGAKVATTDGRAYDGLNRDTTITAVSGGYDANGNLTSEGTAAGQRTFTYDMDNRLLTAVTAGTTGSNITLTYDPSGRLSSYTKGTDTWQFLYDASNLIAEYKNGTMERRYMHTGGTDQPFVQFAGTSVAATNAQWLYANYQGSIVALANSTGAMTELYRYGPWGEPYVGAYDPASIGATPLNFTGSRFRYTGQTVLPDAQLYYYKARVYDPKYGRFLQTDPIGTKDDMDLYAYVAGDPINKADALGLAPNAHQAVSAANIAADIRQYNNLQDVLDSHRKTRLNKYFYTKKYGWIDFKHFIASAQLVADNGDSHAVATVKGYGMEAVEAVVETFSNADYNSGFSYEDLTSNRAGREFGDYIRKSNGDINEAFSKWSEDAGAQDIDETENSAPLAELPSDDPARSGHLQRKLTGSGKSEPDEDHKAGECHYIDAGGGYSCDYQ